MGWASARVPGKGLLLVGLNRVAVPIEQQSQVPPLAPIVDADAGHRTEVQARGLAAQPVLQCTANKKSPMMAHRAFLLSI